MATSPLFGWEEPDDTDLVKDGAAAMRTLGNAIDTSMGDLLGGTTGQILSKASDTNMDFTWITNDVGDITAVTASSPLTGGGTSGAISVGIQDGTTTQKGAVQLENSTSSTSTTTAAVPASVKSAYDLASGAVPKSLVDAAGDLLVGTADNTVGRLGIGSSGQVLTVSGGTPAWTTPAGQKSFTLLSTTTLNGASTYTVSGLSGYDIFYVELEDFSSSASLFVTSMQLNGDSTKHHLMGGQVMNSGSTSGGLYRVSTANTASFDLQRGVSTCMAGVMIFGANTSGVKTVQVLAGNNGEASTYGNFAMGKYTGTSVISSIRVFMSSGNFDAGTMRIYGAV